MPVRNYLTYEDARDEYGINIDVLHVMKCKNKLDSRIFKKSGKYVYVDVNYFIRYKNLKEKIKHQAQLAAYFLENFTSNQHAGRIVAALYGGSGASLAEAMRVDLFILTEDSLTSLQVSKNMLRIFSLYRKIKHLLRQYGLSVNDAFEDRYYKEAKQVFYTIATLSNGEKEDIELRVKDFDSVEDYYDYFKARRHLENVKRKT